MHLRQVKPRNRRADRVRAGGDQQFVVATRAAVGQLDLFARSVDLVDPLLQHFDVLILEVLIRVAQVSAALIDVIDQVIRDRHARVRRFGLVTNDGDIRVGVGFAQGFRGNHAGRTRTYDDMLHDSALFSEKPLGFARG